MTAGWSFDAAAVAPAAYAGNGHPSAADGSNAADAVVDSRAVNRVREAVSRQLGGVDLDALDEETRRLRLRDLVVREVEALTLARAVDGAPALSDAAEAQLVSAALAGLQGLGPVEPLLKMPGVEDILFTGCEPVMLRMAGRVDNPMVPGPPIADSDEELEALIRQLGSTLADGSVREFSVARPLMTVRLKSVGSLGARLSAGMDVLPRPAGTIRVHRFAEASLWDAYLMRMIDRPLYELLSHAVLACAKILFVGAMRTGKTFLLRCACSVIPTHKMIITVEDDRELGLHVLPARDQQGQLILDAHGQPRPQRPAALVRPYEARPANSEGAGAVTSSDLLCHALRDSGDVIILGESRGPEIRYLLDAATNGTANVMGTLHANSASEVFERLVLMSLQAYPPLPVEWALRAAAALDLVVHVKQDRTGARFVSEVIDVRSGPLGPTGVPEHGQLFKPRPDGRAVPYGTLNPGLLEQLEQVGFDRKLLDAGLSDWDRADGDASDRGRADGVRVVGDESAWPGGGRP